MPRELIEEINLYQAGNKLGETENGPKKCQHKAIMNCEMLSVGVGWGVSAALLVIWHGKVKGKLIEFLKYVRSGGLWAAVWWAEEAKAKMSS